MTRTVGAGVEVEHGAQPGEQAGVLRHVVAGLAQGLGELDEDAAGRGVTDEGAVTGDARVAPGPTVGLDDEPAARPAGRRLHQPLTDRTRPYGS